MKKINICIFGGTTEGRLLAEFLSHNDIEADLYVATEYGEQFVHNLNSINVYKKRLDEKEMVNMFYEKNYDLVIDATHPFARIVSDNIVKASYCCNLKYIRIIRKSLKSDYCKYFDNVEEVVDYIYKVEGNVLLTIGSKALDKFTRINCFSERIYIRILPMMESLQKAIDLGYLNKNIICMQGPFSEELNIATINSLKARYVVTKETSNSGGFEEKVAACMKTGVECLVIRQPDEEGLTVDELCVEILKKKELLIN